MENNIYIFGRRIYIYILYIMCKWEVYFIYIYYVDLLLLYIYGFNRSYKKLPLPCQTQYVLLCGEYFKFKITIDDFLKYCWRTNHLKS